MLSGENFWSDCFNVGYCVSSSFYLLQELIVLHCGYFLIHMGLRYSKNMFVLEVYRQNVLYFYRIWGFFYNNVCLQKDIMVILFWCKYKTIKYFLRNLENLICFLIISILRRIFLVLLVRVIVGFVFFPISIVDEVFLIQKVTFL